MFVRRQPRDRNPAAGDDKRLTLKDTTDHLSIVISKLALADGTHVAHRSANVLVAAKPTRSAAATARVFGLPDPPQGLI
jgi:hypothetical protein